MAGNIYVYSSGKINRSFAKTMKLNHKTQQQVGDELGYTQAMISKLVHGKGRLQIDQIQSLLNSLPKHNEELLQEFLSEISDGFVPRTVSPKYQLMDAGNLDARVIAECNQAAVAFASATDEFGRPRESVADLRDPIEAFNQGYDLIKYVYPFLISIAEYLNCSMQELANKREKVLKQNGYKVM